MAVTPADLLALGVQLSTAPDEASLRGASSRLYYAAFHRCKSWHEDTLPATGATPTWNAGSHQILIHMLRNPAVACNAGTKVRSKVLGSRLDQMRILRKMADYELADTLTAAENDQQRRGAVHVLALCDDPLPA